ncbi:MAG: CARDB domain-containing protein, partial [Kiritimatiellia bacterium]
YIIAKADADEAMPKELSESNNTRSYRIKVGPDLTVYSFTGPSSAVAGSVVTVTVVVKNTGGGDAAGSTVRVYFSADTVLDSGDEEIGSGEVGSLVPAGSESCVVMVNVPGWASAGTWYLIVEADADGVVAETNEGNNTRTKAITVKLPAGM